MTAPVVSDDAVALIEKIEHLRIPIIAAQRPSMVKDDRLGTLRPPVLKIDLGTVLGGDCAHHRCSFGDGTSRPSDINLPLGPIYRGRHLADAAFTGIATMTASA